ncbi:MAG: VOC family protein [Myxococcota bacterium]
MDRLATHLEGAHVHHAIDYIELSVTDMDAAMAFYRAAFGWEFTAYGPGYAGIRGATKEMGGLTLVDEVKTGGPLIVLYSLALVDTLETVRRAGATITKEIFSFPGGERFEFLDPAGNALAVWCES